MHIRNVSMHWVGLAGWLAACIKTFQRNWIKYNKVECSWTNQTREFTFKQTLLFCGCNHRLI